MAKANKSRKPEQKKTILIAVLAFLLVATIFGIYSNYQARVGKAVSVGETPWISGVIDLVAHETVTFTAPLPDENGKVFTIKTGTSPYDTNPLEYYFNLSKRDATTYQFFIERPGVGIARDILALGAAPDRSLVYLDNTDAVPDLEISAQNGQIIVKNLHYISPDTAKITLRDDENVVYPSIIRVPLGEGFTATVWANSTMSPTLRVTVGELTEITNGTNSTTATFTFPTQTESAAIILDMIATVRGQDTHAYYTLAVGDVAYALQESGFPNMTLKLLDETTANFTVTFARTTQLQPFALPCVIEEDDSVNALFENTAVYRVYAYDTENEEALLWQQGAVPPDEFSGFEDFSGYFVQLKELAESDSTTLSTECTVQSLSPPKGVPSLASPPESTTLPAGWNLVSLPGVVPYQLGDFTTMEDFRLFTCKQNYECSELPATTPLLPGKPYWVLTEDPLQLRYTLE